MYSTYGVHPMGVPSGQHGSLTVGSKLGHHLGRLNPVVKYHPTQQLVNRGRWHEVKVPLLAKETLEDPKWNDPHFAFFPLRSISNQYQNAGGYLWQRDLQSRKLSLYTLIHSWLTSSCPPAVPPSR